MKQAVTESSLRRLLRQRGRQARPETIVKLARALGMSARRLQAMADAAYDAEHQDRAVAS